MAAEITQCERCGSAVFNPEEGCKNCEVIAHRMEGRSQQEKDALAASMKAGLERAAVEVGAMNPEEKAQLTSEADAENRQLEEEGRLPSQDEILETPPEQLRQESASRRFQLPQDVPPLREEQCRVVAGLVELTSHDGQPLPGCAVGFYAKGWYWGIDRGGEIEWLNEFPWHLMTAIKVNEGETNKRLTAPRAVALGLFSLGLKKARKTSYLELVADGGTRIFEVQGKNAHELRAELTPVISWLDHYHLSIKAFSEVY
jgi:hypothetical protein